MFGWGHGVVWKDAATTEPLCGLLESFHEHAASRHNPANRTPRFVALITLGSPQS
jgi:hypothetical protein